jgi:ABC-type nitrate/sulfonate/bicarbonate transport system substrate-binding protein
MSSSTRLTVGQFSESPVLAAARALGLDQRHGLELTTVRVPSSPGQFTALRDGAIDVAITSPDNVLLYATTDSNPVGARIPVRMVRAIDRGLGLALVTRPEVATVEQLQRASLAVDVVRSGFALLLFTMLDRIGVDRGAMTFAELGSTPTRLAALLAGEADGSILNAESRVGSLAAGMRTWMSSVDVAPNYLGTVLAVADGFDPGPAAALSALWDEATEWLLTRPEPEVAEVLGRSDPALGSPEYVRLIRDPGFGLLREPAVATADLQVLTGIRRACGAYAPDDSALPGLVGL